MSRASMHILVSLLLLLSASRSQQLEDPELVSTRAYGMAELHRLFQQAALPRESSLVGRWVMIRHVATEMFVLGQSGPDRILFDMEGVRAGGKTTEPLEWVLTLNGPPLRAVERDIYSLTLSAVGELVFFKDHAGDSEWVYRCRLVSTRRLVCLLRGHEDGHGVEFFKFVK